MRDPNRPFDPIINLLASFDLNGTIAHELRADEAYNHGRTARALVKSPELSVVASALDKGSEMKPHHSPGPAFVLVLEGKINFRTWGEVQEDVVLGPGMSVAFSSELSHSVEALEESFILIVMGGKRPG